MLKRWPTRWRSSRRGCTRRLAVATARVFLGEAREASRLILDAADAALGGGRMAHDLQLRAYLGLGLAFAEEWQRAREVLAELIADCERTAPALVTYPLISQGWLERGTGRWDAAVTDLEVALQRSVEAGRANDECWAHSVLAWIRAAQGQAAAVEAHVARQLELDRTLEPALPGDDDARRSRPAGAGRGRCRCRCRVAGTGVGHEAEARVLRCQHPAGDHARPGRGAGSVGRHRPRRRPGGRSCRRRRARLGAGAARPLPGAAGRRRGGRRAVRTGGRPARAGRRSLRPRPHAASAR